MKLLSIVIPAYNEEDMVLKAAHKITQLLQKEHIPFEILFINDGSTDTTWLEIQKASQELQSVKGICFSRNFGKEASILAGLAQAKGDCCVVMDCDLQHPPETVIEMYQLWLKGFDIVEGVKAFRGDEGKVHGLFTKSFYKLINWATGFDMESSSDFKLLDKKVVDAYLNLPERKLFFRALSYWLGFNSTTIEFNVQERETGTTKWSYMSLLKYAISNITSFSSAPMQFVTLIGVLFFGFSVILGIQSLINFINGDSLEGFTTIILLLLGIGSIIMMSLGIIGYYISKIYEEIKRRPRYIVSTRQPMKVRLMKKLLMLMDEKLWKFILVGIINTLVGTAIMFGLYNLAGASYWLSSSANYTLTSILSFFLNKHFTFQNKDKSMSVGIRFAINIAICYVLAYGVAKPVVLLLLANYSLVVQDNVAMFVGMFLFTAFNYIGQRFFAFKES